MEELVKYIVCELAEFKDEVEVKLNEDNVIKVVVKKSDMGKIIGKEGRIAKSIRTIVKAAGQKNNIKYSVEISEKE